MKNIFLLFVLIVIIPITTLAQSSSPIGDLFDFSNIELPTEVQDLFRTADRVQEGVQDIPLVEQATEQIKECIALDGSADCIDIKNPSEAVESVREFFSKVNNWFQKTIGVYVGYQAPGKSRILGSYKQT